MTLKEIFFQILNGRELKIKIEIVIEITIMIMNYKKNQVMGGVVIQMKDHMKDILIEIKNRMNDLSAQ